MNIVVYITLIDSFVAGRIPPEEFESRYLKLFKEEQQIPPGQVFEVLNRLFTDVDAFCSDPALRNEYSIDESELRDFASRAYRDLKALEGDGK
jgi:hypothetical protein